MARDTLITSITVWRVPEAAGISSGIHLFILRTYPNGQPYGAPLLDGPTVYNSGGDGTQPIEFAFHFDPPFALPSRGLYEMALMTDPCDWSDAILVRYQAEDAYIEGEAWAHSRSADNPCTPRSLPVGHPEADLVFSITFCSMPTPIHAPTWGQVKVHYR